MVVQWIRQTPYVVTMWRPDSYCSGLRSVVDVLRPIRVVPVSVTVADSDAKHSKADAETNCKSFIV